MSQDNLGMVWEWAQAKAKHPWWVKAGYCWEFACFGYIAAQFLPAVPVVAVFAASLIPAAAWLVYLRRQ